MPAAVTDGPFDADALDLEQTDGVGRLDFGAVRVPMPANARLQIDPVPGGRLRAVHVLVPQGRLSLSALAAPRSSGLWRSLSAEIAASLRRDGAQVRSERGLWGREVAAGAKGALSRFIGVDGSRWMLYGVAAGPVAGADELAATLRQMIRGTVVVRGPEPYPVKTVLPMHVPPHLEAQVDAARDGQVEEPPADREQIQTGGDREQSHMVPPSHVVHQPPAVPPSHVDHERAVREWAARELDQVERDLAYRDWAARELDRVEHERMTRARERAGEPTAPLPVADPVTGPIPQPPVPDPITAPLPVVPRSAAGQPSGADVGDELETPPAWPRLVVTEPELSQLPAWAILAAAPQYWLDQRPGRHRAGSDTDSQ